jgi:hypothetical protein
LPEGSRHSASLAVEKLLDGEAEEIGRKAVAKLLRAEQAKGSSKARSIADQAAGIDGPAPRIDRRNGMP